MSKISVIIPCYNYGKYIEEAVNSVLNQTYQDFEIIVINDGSTDDFTNEFLNNYKNDKVKIIDCEHQGVGNVRNIGIEQASGEYILPLDADDKIGEKYLELASNVLDSHPEIGIVYCNAEFFGNKSGKWKLNDYSVENILKTNCIFSSAMYRKSDWALAGGYKSDMIYGYEDWDFWLSLIELGKDVYKLEETLFYYRKHSKTSTVETLRNDAKKVNYTKIKLLAHHENLYLQYSDMAKEMLCRQEYLDGKFKYPKYKKLFNITFVTLIIYVIVSIAVFIILSK